MDVQDYNIISNCKRDYALYILPNKISQDAVDAQIDTYAVIWAIISMVIHMLGDQANCWNYQIEELNNHVSVWPSEPGINENIITNLEDSAKRNLRIHGHYILEPTRIENLEETSKSKGPLTSISDDIGLICDCWLDYNTKLGLIRSGNFIKNEACKDSARDLELWRFRNDMETDLNHGEKFLQQLRI